MRIRTIKPEFWLHEGLCGCSEFARLLAIALLNWSDDEGYFMAHPSLIRGSLFPFLEDSKIVPRSLQDLSRVGWIELGKDDQGRPVGRVTNFLKHQRIDKPQASKIKGSSVFLEPSKNDLGTILDDSQGEWKGMEGEEEQGKEGNKEQGESSLPFPSLEFSKAWKDWTKHRTEIMKPLKPTQITKQLEELQAIGEKRAIAMINHTISKGWQGLREPEIEIEFPVNDPRCTEFLSIFTERYHAMTESAYPLGDTDRKTLKDLLAALPDLTAETWREALEWCQDTAQKEGRYAPKIIATGNLAAFCSNWSSIVAYSQTYQEPKK